MSIMILFQDNLEIYQVSLGLRQLIAANIASSNVNMPKLHDPWALLPAIIFKEVIIDYDTLSKPSWQVIYFKLE